MTEQRRVQAEIEVPVTPEQAWEAIATGPGITAWFMPAEVEGRVGGTVVHHHEADAASSGTIIAYERPHHFAYEEESEEFTPPGGPPTMATEFLVEARSGGSCVVRVVMSGFGEGDAWERAIESFASGWRQALVSLRLYLMHFQGEPVGSLNAVTVVKESGTGELWSRLVGRLGLPARPAPGDRVAVAPDAPALEGIVEESDVEKFILRLERPLRGIGFVGVGGPGGDEVYVVVRAQLFGEDAAEIAAREQAAWQAWFAEHWAAA